MGRRKANRALNGIHTYLYLLGYLQNVKYPLYCEYGSSYSGYCQSIRDFEWF